MSLSYDQIAGIYDSLYGQEQYRKNAVASTFIKGKEKIIDIGCGTGILGEMLQNSEYYLCVDLSEGMLQVFKRKKLKVLSDALLADAEHLPLREASFEVATCITVLHEAPMAIEQIHRVLIPNGLAVLSLKKTLRAEPSLEGFALKRIIESGGDTIYILETVKQMPSHHPSE